jgi:thymidylate synthase
MHSIKAHDAADAWFAAVTTCDVYGHNVLTEDGKMTREVYNLVIEIAHPGLGYPIPGSKWNLVGLEEYAKQIFNPDEQGFDYTYGHRLARNNQINVAIEHLRNNPTTRRAILTTRDLEKDLFAQHTPCLQVVEFLARGRQLDMTCFFRSHDIKQAYPANVYGLHALQRYVAADIDIPTGSLTTISCSAHYYIE